MSGILAASGLFLSRYDPDMRAIFDRMAVLPSNDWARRQDVFMRAMKSAGIWQILDTLAVAAGGETEQARLLDWKRSGVSYELAGANAATNSTYGFEVGASSYVDTLYNPASGAVNVTQNSHTAFAWITRVPDYASGDIIAPFCISPGNQVLLRIGNTDRRIVSAINNTTCNTTAAEATLDADELYAVGRDTSTSVSLVKGSSVVKTNTGSSSAFFSQTMKVCNIESPSVTVPCGVGVFGWGAFLDTTKLAALKAAIQALLA